MGEQLGCASLARAVDARLAWELLAGVHGDLAGAASLATQHRRALRPACLAYVGRMCLPGPTCQLRAPLSAGW